MGLLPGPSTASLKLPDSIATNHDTPMEPPPAGASFVSNGLLGLTSSSLDKLDAGSPSRSTNEVLTGLVGSPKETGFVSNGLLGFGTPSINHDVEQISQDSERMSGSFLGSVFVSNGLLGDTSSTENDQRSLSSDSKSVVPLHIATYLIESSQSGRMVQLRLTMLFQLAQ